MSSSPYRLLVVANETVGGRALIDAILRCGEKVRGEGRELSVRVVCPQNQPKKGFVVYDETVREAAENRRLAHTLGRLREAGLEAVGQVMDPDPFTAIQNALQFYAVDEIVISTFPATRSGWMRADLVERVQASTSLPVEHVVVNPSEATAKVAGCW